MHETTKDHQEALKAKLPTRKPRSQEKPQGTPDERRLENLKRRVCPKHPSAPIVISSLRKITYCKTCKRVVDLY